MKKIQSREGFLPSLLLCNSVGDDAKRLSRANELKNFDCQSTKLVQVELDLFEDHPRFKNHPSFNRSNKRSVRLHGVRKNDQFYRYEDLQHAIHGTAVASILIDEEFGICPTANYFFTGSEKSTQTPKTYESSLLSILKEVNKSIEVQNELKPGDIVSISIQINCNNLMTADHLRTLGIRSDQDVFLPIDANPMIGLTLKKITDAGIIVFVAAGNSSVDLDSFELPAYLSMSDDTTYSDLSDYSGAIKVGFLGNNWESKYDTNFGKCVDFFAPCNAIAAACYGKGVGNHANGDRNTHTDLIDTYAGGFGKSSAATPIVAGIAAHVQSRYKKRNGRPATKTELVQIMKEKAIVPRQSGLGVGTFPCMESIISHPDIKAA